MYDKEIGSFYYAMYCKFQIHCIELLLEKGCDNLQIAKQEIFSLCDFVLYEMFFHR